MFTGILKLTAPVSDVQEREGLKSFAIVLPWRWRRGLKIGASVSIDGVCLTVVRRRRRRVYFDVIDETLQKTTLGDLQEGDSVNVERSFRVGDEVGGHIVSGHVAGTAEIVDIQRPPNNVVMTFKIPPAQMKYVFEKGFIALNGASLTLVDVDRKKGTFSVHLIPETLSRTTFGQKQVGNQVNYEIDARTQAIVDTAAGVSL